MKYRENVHLSTLTTMQIDGIAKYVVEITTKNDLVKAIDFAREQNLPYFVLGGGSNVVPKGDFNGLIMLNRLKGFEKLDENQTAAIYKIGAGEIWDSVVERLVSKNLSGVEAMSAIPGYAGSTPIQNVGAYGQEIADVLTELEAYDTKTGEFVILQHDDCGFSYRNSIFKNPATRHHIITSITLQLNKKPLDPPFYPALQKYLDNKSITSKKSYTPMEIRHAVMAIRADKLPNPASVASAGSFFKNPIVSSEEAQKLLGRFPDMPHWSVKGDWVKLSAGWLIDQAGLKGFKRFGFQIYPKNALVITNVGQGTADGLRRFVSAVAAKVEDQFGLRLEQEPEELQ